MNGADSEAKPSGYLGFTVRTSRNPMLPSAKPEEWKSQAAKVIASFSAQFSPQK